MPHAYQTLTFCSLLTTCTVPCACHTKRHLNVQKCSEPLSFFALLTSQCASRHNGVHFFIVSTSKSGPSMVCFVHLNLEMCFAPQRRALFRHLIFKKCSEPGVLCTFWLGHVLRATTACNCSSLIWPTGSAPAALASLLFDPPEPQIIRKTPCFATFLPFHAPGSSFFWDFLFFDLLSSSLLLSDSSHLCFSPVHIVGSLTSKLPSTIVTPRFHQGVKNERFLPLFPIGREHCNKTRWSKLSMEEAQNEHFAWDFLRFWLC